MYDDPSTSAQQLHANQTAGFDPRHIDPRKAVDPAIIEKMVRAQSAVRAQAQAATTVYIATILGLASSAFGLIAALAWNSAITQILSDNLNGPLAGLHLPKGTILLIYALIVTLIGVFVIAMLNRVGRRVAAKSMIEK